MKLVKISPGLNWDFRDFGVLVGTQFGPGEMGERNKKKRKRENVSIAQNWLVLIHLFFCHACEKWTHWHCAKVSNEQIELLEQIEGAM